jgi:hypothetical protein
VGANGQLYRSTGRGVDQCVGDQVGHHLTEFVLVAQHVHGAVSRGQGHRAVWVAGSRIVHRVGGQHEQVDVGDVQGPLVIEPGEQQQIVDEKRPSGSPRPRSGR